MEPQTEYSAHYTNGKAKANYPMIYLSEYDESSLPILLSHYSEGDIQLVVDYKGKKAALMKIPKTPEIIKTFFLVGKVNIMYSKEDIVAVESILDLLLDERFDWTR